MENRITGLFGVRYPIIQGGMIWCSGWRLASAVSNAGGLGLIGAGSMYPDVLREHIKKAFQATHFPFGVNVPLLYPQVDEIMHIIVEEGVPVVFTSAGNPSKWTTWLKERGIKVAHVVSSAKFAQKCENAGVDAIVAEGFEAGGHNGREESTTLTLIPLVRENTQLPLIAAGGIAGGRAALACFALGAEGVQIGTRFAASTESSAHPLFKQQIIQSVEGDTVLALKKVVPVRLLKNHFAEQVQSIEDQGGNAEQLLQLLGKGRAKLGMFEGDIEAGELEIGQAAAQVTSIQDVAEIMKAIIQEYNHALQALSGCKWI